MRVLRSANKGGETANGQDNVNLYRYGQFSFVWYELCPKRCCFRRSKLYYNQARRKRCGMAAVAAPKICRERERKGRKGKKKERERERGKGRERRNPRRKGKERERESKRACVVGVNTSFELLQNCKRHGKGGGEGEKTQGKDSGLKM